MRAVPWLGSCVVEGLEARLSSGLRPAAAWAAPPRRSTSVAQPSRSSGAASRGPARGRPRARRHVARQQAGEDQRAAAARGAADAAGEPRQRPGQDVGEDEVEAPAAAPARAGRRARRRRRDAAPTPFSRALSRATATATGSMSPATTRGFSAFAAARPGCRCRCRRRARAAAAAASARRRGPGGSRASCRDGRCRRRAPPRSRSRGRSARTARGHGRRGRGSARPAPAQPVERGCDPVLLLQERRRWRASAASPTIGRMSSRMASSSGSSREIGLEQPGLAVLGLEGRDRGLGRVEHLAEEFGQRPADAFVGRKPHDMGRPVRMQAFEHEARLASAPGETEVLGHRSGRNDWPQAADMCISSVSRRRARQGARLFASRNRHFSCRATPWRVLPASRNMD